MRVLLNCLSSRSGGAVAYLRNILAPLAAELQLRDSTLLMLLRDDQQSLAPDSLPPSQSIVIPTASVEGMRRLLWERQRLGVTAEQTGADVLFTPYQMGTHVVGRPSVSMLRNMEPFFSSGYSYSLPSRVRNQALRGFSARFLRASNAVIAVSDYVAEYARDVLLIPADRITRIYHGRDLSFRTQDSSKAAANLSRLNIDAPFIFTCGSLLPYRRVEDVIEAFGRLSGTATGHPLLVIAGSGTDALYQKRITSAMRLSPAAERIRYVGHIDKESMISLYTRCRVFVTSTEIEACPNIALEAMTAGCRIVAANTSILREMFGRAAAYYPARDMDTLTTMISDALRAAVDDNRQRSATLERSESFSWQLCARQTAELLTGLHDKD